MRTLLRITASGICAVALTNGIAQFQQGCITITSTSAPAEDGTSGVAQTTDGGFVVAGRTAAGLTHPLVRKLDMNGAVLWSKAFAVGSFVNTAFTEVLATADGGALLAGWTEACAALGRSVMLMKMDPAGNVEWTKNYGEPVVGFLTTQSGGLVQLNDGGFAFCGLGSRQFFVIRLNAQADLLWSRSFETSGFGFNGRGLAEMPDGGLVLCARSNTTRSTVLIRLEANGNTSWVKEYEFGASIFSKTNEPYQIAVTQDGNIVFAGYFTTPDTSWFGIGGEADMLVTKVDPDGLPIWATVLGTDTTVEYVYAMVPTPDGGVALGGRSFTFMSGYFRSCAAKLDADGQLLWSQVFGTVDYATIYRASLATDGDILFTGEYSLDPGNTLSTRLWKMDQAGTSCPTCLAAPWAVAEYTDSIEYYIPSYIEGSGWAAQDSSTFIITDNTASVSSDVCGIPASVDEVTDDPVILVYPNPFSISTTITLPEGWARNGVQLVLFDAMGKEVVRKAIMSSSTMIDAQELTIGVYHYRLFTQDGEGASGMLIVAGR